MHKWLLLVCLTGIWSCTPLRQANTQPASPAAGLPALDVQLVAIQKLPATMHAQPFTITLKVVNRSPEPRKVRAIRSRILFAGYDLFGEMTYALSEIKGHSEQTVILSPEVPLANSVRLFNELALTQGVPVNYDFEARVIRPCWFAPAIVIKHFGQVVFTP